MITITSLGGTSLRCEIDGKAVVSFPTKPDEKAKLSLLAGPEEQVKPGVISWPGEYDIDGLAIRGIGHNEGQRVSYVVDNGDVRVAFISSPLHEWNDYEMEQLGDIDILCLPADDAKLGQKMLDDVDPRVLVPLPTKDEKTFLELLKIAGAQDKELVPEFKLKGSLPMEGREVVILKPAK